MALGLCIQFIDIATRRNIEQTPIYLGLNSNRFWFFNLKRVL
jgi:hypothetical protein